jgi:protein gp37
MNSTRIEWCDMTWNPATGCLYGCKYCYAAKIANRFAGKWTADKGTCITFRKHHNHGYPELTEQLERKINGKAVKVAFPFGFTPTFHHYRLDEPAQKTKGVNIFVCSMADLFGSWVPDEWITAVFKACEAAPQHRYLFLTKNPRRYMALEDEKRIPWADNIWIGTTVTKPADELVWFKEKQFHWFVSLEPLHEGVDITAGDGPPPEWVIVGAESGNRKGKITPPREWIEKIARDCTELGIPLFMKDSIIPIIGEENMRREFPDGLRRQQA